MGDLVTILGVVIGVLQIVNLIINSNTSAQVSALKTEVVNMMRDHERAMHYTEHASKTARGGAR